MCEYKAGSLVSITVIILLEPLFFSILSFLLYPILFYRFGRLQGPQAVINQMVSETPGKADALCASWRVDVCVYLKPPFSTCAFPREDGLVLVHTWRVLQLMKINLRIRWSNLTPLGSGAQGEKYITNGQFSIWSSRVKKVCKKKKKKLAQIKPQKYLSNLKKELSETVTEGEVWFQALRWDQAVFFCTLIFSEFGDLDRLQNSGQTSNSCCVVMIGGQPVQVWWDKFERRTDSFAFFSWSQSRYFNLLFPFSFCVSIG